MADKISVHFFAASVFTGGSWTNLRVSYVHVMCFCYAATYIIQRLTVPALDTEEIRTDNFEVGRVFFMHIIRTSKVYRKLENDPRTYCITQQYISVYPKFLAVSESREYGYVHGAGYKYDITSHHQTIAILSRQNTRFGMNEFPWTCYDNHSPLITLVGYRSCSCARLPQSYSTYRDSLIIPMRTLLDYSLFPYLSYEEHWGTTYHSPSWEIWLRGSLPAKTITTCRRCRFHGSSKLWIMRFTAGEMQSSVTFRSKSSPCFSCVPSC